MNYSFRKKNKKVKYIVIHYTGMKSLKSAYKRLSDNNSNVSIHYLISRKGIIFNLLCPSFKAWHSGKSKWKNHTNLNDYSIGIELENKGHNFGYENFTNEQYHSLKKIIYFFKINNMILDNNIVYHSDISPNRKMDPGEKFIINKIGIERFRVKNNNNNKYSLDKLLNLYGFHNSYIKNHKKYCIKAVKRTLNYKNITYLASKKFMKDFYNLLFN